MKNTAHLWQLGNEPNLNGEAIDWANQQITPAHTRVYRDPRNAINAPALAGPAGDAQSLVAPVSPGGVINGVRWISGNDWLDQTLAAIPAAEVDGIALHSYGGQPTARRSSQDFRKGLLDQLDVIDGRGLGHVPVYLTEWNRGTQIGSAGDEAVTADFVRQSMKFLDRWNPRRATTTSWHQVVRLRLAGQRRTGWDTYSIEYWKTHGGGGAGDLLPRPSSTPPAPATSRASRGRSPSRRACRSSTTLRRTTICRLLHLEFSRRIDRTRWRFQPRAFSRPSTHERSAPASHLALPLLSVPLSPNTRAPPGDLCPA